jgi:large subunit ribosomal protein L6
MSLIDVVEKEVIIPENVEVTIAKQRIGVKGPLGSLLEDISHLPVKIERQDNKLILKVIWPRKKEIALVGTAASIIRNMIKGVTEGFTYKLEIVYAHFPVTIKVNKEKRELTIENFIGEKVPRKVKICGETDIQVQGDNITVKGNRVQDVSQTAANIENATNIKDKDKRVFLDGIYIYSKTEGPRR